jgi:hypothetical protein
MWRKLMMPALAAAFVLGGLVLPASEQAEAAARAKVNFQFQKI